MGHIQSTVISLPDFPRAPFSKRPGKCPFPAPLGWSPQGLWKGDGRVETLRDTFLSTAEFQILTPAQFFF